MLFNQVHVSFPAAFTWTIPNDTWYWLKDGITNGELDFLGLVDNIALTFFPWKSPKFIFTDIAFWIVAILGMIASAVVFIADPAAGIAVGGALSFASAGVQEVSFLLQPEWVGWLWESDYSTWSLTAKP